MSRANATGHEHTIVTKALPLETIEGEVLIRDPKPTWARLLGVIAGLPVAIAYVAFRIWLGRKTGFFGAYRHDDLPGVLSALAGWFLLVAAFSLIRLPMWVSVGPSGVAFRSWFRVGEYRWAEIGSFELGNPTDARFAYIILPSTQQPSRAVRLPAFTAISPSELVATLRRKQRLHVGS